MNENTITSKRTYRDIFPNSTSIIDFAYTRKHPLRVGEFSISNIDDAEHHDFEYDNAYNDRESESESDDEDHNYSSDEINCRAVALFDFTPENDNEVALTEGQIIWISYRHGQGWLVAEDSESGENGLVPEEYVEIYYDDDNDDDEIEDIGKHKEIIDDIPKPFLPEILQNNNIKKSEESDSEWIDTDDDVETGKNQALMGNFNKSVHGVHKKYQHKGQQQSNHSNTEIEVNKLQENVEGLSLS